MTEGRKGQRARGLGRAFATAFDLPQDAVANLPRLVMVGNTEVRIDNHRGLIHCSPERVIVGAGPNQITIQGISLVLEHAYREHILITGDIRAVTFED